jgi:hypothetical protein
LTGSANLSRSALLRSADKGNIEIGIISSGACGAFENLYSHLQRKPIKDLSSLGISYRGGTDGDPDASPHPVVLWSRLDGTTLTFVLDRPVLDGTAIDLQDHAGRAITWGSIDFDTEGLRTHLTKESAEGGPMEGRCRSGSTATMSRSAPLGRTTLPT